ncbi:hypothetical protein CKAH01_03644 [Colletotrichum kahawae]|uniref:Protein phosphatase 4 core regulatory subunit R2 n=1 Tax=Colletotrichum kahawae TaxID=34407 RepID=A0AAE0DBS6_COLKA|nr:hypothetical protein CKAH01_03644 [Colletotrichum kahawae]
MEIEVDDDLLRTVASGGQMDYGLWPAMSQDIITRLDKIAHNDFPIPNLPPLPQHINPPGQQQTPPLEPAAEPSSSQEADKENSQPTAPAPAAESDATEAATAAPTDPGSLPAQIEAMLTEIKSVLASFPKYPPHTIQRLAELVIEPRRHYRHLASYLHAVDRVVHVTSGANIYPLPPAIPDVSAMTLLSNGTLASNNNNNTNGSSSPPDPAAAVSWGNSTNSVASTVGTDEALGGALLTPIPWLTRRPSPGSASPASSSGGGPNNGPAEIRTESTETIDGPNGVGSIETARVSANGIPSMGATRHISTAGGPAAGPAGITQGELLRQEQEQGVVPVNQLARQTEEAHLQAAALRAAAAAGGSSSPGSGGEGGGGGNSPEKQQPGGGAAAEDENEVPHARGPEEIGAEDLGPQSVTTSFVGGPGMEMQGIDVEAAVGRKAASNTPPATAAAALDEDSQTEDASSVTMEAESTTAGDDAASETSTITTHSKRDADAELEGLASKKIKEGDGDVVTAGEDASPVKNEEEDDDEKKDGEIKEEADVEVKPKEEDEDEEMKTDVKEEEEEEAKVPKVEDEEKKERTAPPPGIE